jgi:MarR family transcriptional regulator, organic hydroperoxide resistance regulator
MSGTRTAARTTRARNGSAPKARQAARAVPPRASNQTTLDRIVETAIYLQTESRRLAREQCARHGITATQLNVLKLLQTVGELSLSEVSRRMAATNSTVTGIIDRMTAANLVEREQSTEDRRVWKIRLTPDGRAMARKVEVAPWEILRTAVTALPAAELEQLITTLAKVADHVERVVGEANKKNPGEPR